MFKNVATKLAIFAFDTTSGAPKTGDAANMTAYVSKDYGAVTVLADTSATEMDSTNAKGWYLFDLAQAETNADALIFTGKSSTANISLVGQWVFTTPANFTATSIDSNGRVDVIKVAGTTQTAGDIIGDTNDIQSRLPAALVSGRIDASVGAMAANVITAAATAADFTTEVTSGLSTLDAAGVRTAVGLASANLDTQLGAIDDFLDTEVAAIKTKTDFLPSVTAGNAGGLFIAGANAATTVNFTGSLSGSVGSVTGAVGSVTGSVGGNVVGSVASVTAGVTVTTNSDKTGYAIGAGGIANTAFAAGAIDSAAIAANAIGASELAQDAAREIADEVLDRDLAGGGSGNTRNVRNALRSLRNKAAIAGGTLTVYQENDTDAAWTAAVTTAAGNPIDSIDPA